MTKASGCKIFTHGDFPSSKPVCDRECAAETPEYYMKCDFIVILSCVCVCLPRCLWCVCPRVPWVCVYWVWVRTISGGRWAECCSPWRASWVRRAGCCGGSWRRRRSRRCARPRHTRHGHMVFTSADIHCLPLFLLLLLCFTPFFLFLHVLFLFLSAPSWATCWSLSATVRLCSASLWWSWGGAACSCSQTQVFKTKRPKIPLFQT